jgi:demethylmenaquinone methyltransferase/2-methoxy-6-polyprenyl-1,4-benzoquinol methylase
LAELARVVRPGAVVASLEFGLPSQPLARAAWNFYTGVGLPLAGRLLGRGWLEVGEFLRRSIEDFYGRLPLDRQLTLWREAGIGGVRMQQMSLGGGIVIWGTRA